MKDRIRYSEAFKLKVMEELRDVKWKSVKEAAMALRTSAIVLKGRFMSIRPY